MVGFIIIFIRKVYYSIVVFIGGIYYEQQKND